METHTSPRRVKGWVLPFLYACFIVSGGAGLVYEVSWSQQLSHLVGGATTTHTAVLVAFMGGLALGNKIGGRWADTGLQPLRLYAYLEAAVGLLGLLSPQLSLLTGDLYVALAPTPGAGWDWLDTPLRFTLATLTVLPASTAMGATLPALVRACTGELSGLGGSVGWLYFINSVGAAVGALLATFYLIPTLGLDLTLISAGSVNALLALATLAVVRVTSRPADARPPKTMTHTPPGARQYRQAYIRAAQHAVFLSGVATMVIELVWTRLLALIMGGSVYAFAIMLSTFIGGIAIGGVLAARIASGDRDVFKPLVIAEASALLSLVALVPFYDELPLVFHGVASLLAAEPQAYPVYLLLCTLVAIAAMLMPTIAFGVTLPLASRVATAKLNEAGRTVGGIFSANTIGNVLGASLGGLVLIPTLGLFWTMVSGMLLVSLAVLRLAVVDGFGSPWITRRHDAYASLALLSMGLFTILTPGWDRVLLHSGLYRTLEHDIGSAEQFKASVGDLRFLYERDDSEASVAVVENDLGRRLLRVNGKSDAGNHRDVPTQVMVAQAPFFFHPEAKRILVVGLGSGISLGSVLAHDVERVDVVEISPAIAEASRLFDEWSGAPLDDPRVHLHVRDARNFLRVLPEDHRFDIIVSEPSNPWQPGSASLFSLDFYEQLKGRLAPGGVIGQWLHTYEMDDDVLEIMMRSFARVFPEPRVLTSRGNDLVMVASDGPLKVDFKAMQTLLSQPRVAAEMARLTPEGEAMDLELLLLHEVMGPRQFRRRWGASEDAMLHTDSHPLLQYAAPKSFFTGANATVFRRNDARHLPRSHAGLLYSAWRPNQPYAVSALSRVDRWLAKRNFKIDRLFANAVAISLWQSEPDNPARLARLEQLELLELVGRERLNEVLAKDEVATSGLECAKRSGALLKQIIARTSILTPQSTAAFERQQRRCLERFPIDARPHVEGLYRLARPYLPVETQ